MLSQQISQLPWPVIFFFGSDSVFSTASFCLAPLYLFSCILFILPLDFFLIPQSLATHSFTHLPHSLPLAFSISDFLSPKWAGPSINLGSEKNWFKWVGRSKWSDDRIWHRHHHNFCLRIGWPKHDPANKIREATFKSDINSFKGNLTKIDKLFLNYQLHDFSFSRKPDNCLAPKKVGLNCKVVLDWVTSVGALPREQLELNWRFDSLTSIEKLKW